MGGGDGVKKGFGIWGRGGGFGRVILMGGRLIGGKFGNGGKVGIVICSRFRAPKHTSLLSNAKNAKAKIKELRRAICS